MAELAIRPPATREDYRALPEGPPYYELIGGELVEMTKPLLGHQVLFSILIELVGGYARRSRMGLLVPAPNLYLPTTTDVYHPDLVYVARKRRAICREDGIWGVPDVVCEILLPSTQRVDRYEKVPRFQAARVPHVWLVSPESPVTVEEYVLEEDGHYRLNAIVQAPAAWQPAAFPGWTLPLAELDAAVAPPET